LSEDTAPQLRGALHRVLAGHDLDAAEAEAAMGEIMAGGAPEGRIAGYLVALRMKGETPAEVVGSARALRAAGTRIAPRREPLVDTCGTGGDDSGTFNISTAAGLVAAAAGAAVAKHGNRSVSSRCGSADVLAELGVPWDAEPDAVATSVERNGFGFLFAPRFHPAIRHAMPARVALGTRTLFNLLGPLTNPAGARRQVMGVFSPDVLELAGEALRGLGAERAFVVHSEDGLDEISLSAPTDVVEVTPGGLHRFRVEPSDFGVAGAGRDAVAGGSAAENADILLQVLGGARGPRRDVVTMNAGLALVAAGVAADFRSGAEAAAAALDDGRASRLLAALREDA
jgi:anthranilate phosphoribosyltransferase